MNVVLHLIAAWLFFDAVVVLLCWRFGRRAP
jgi:hypothetical protein